MAKQFEVECVSDATGATAFLIFDAADAAGAREQANKMGLVAGTVKEMTTPPVQPTIAPPSMPAPTLQVSPVGGRDRFEPLVGFLAGALILVVLFGPGWGVASDRNDKVERFLTDNAVGATANALERVEAAMKRQESLQRWTIGALGLCAAAVVITCRRR